MDEQEFKDIRNKYEQARENERLALTEYLKKHLKNYGDLSVVNGGRAGKGAKKYTNHKTISEFNLDNWKWVEVKSKHNTFSCIISLNMIDVDQTSRNFHALYDRIGLIISSDTPYTKQICTNIDLPLVDETKEKILNLVIYEYDLYTSCLYKLKEN